MVKRVVLGVIGVVVGMVVGMVIMMGLHLASMLVYPPPEGVKLMSQEPEDQERLKEWFTTLPAGAFLLATASHGLGCMAGAAVATLLSGRRSLLPALIVGVVFTIGGIMNLFSIPHPAWFPYVDLPLYLLLALTAGLLLQRKFVEAPPAAK